MTDADYPRERRTGSRARKRRASGPSLITIYWRDIPAQLTARGAGDEQKLLLHARFQHAIDRAAAVAGLTSTNDYVQEWRSVLSSFQPGDIDAQLDRRCADIEAAYPDDRLASIVANGGVDPAPRPAAQSEESS